MEPEGFPRRIEQVGKETLVIMSADQGHRVYAPANPKETYLVRGGPEERTCTCVQSDAQEKCSHILAVEKFLSRSAGKQPAAQPPPKGPTENSPHEPAREGIDASGNGAVSPQMLLKRSVSPDGRIDSLSVEFSVSVEKLSVGDIKNLAQKSLALQTQIVDTFLTHNGNGKGEPEAAEPRTPQENGATPARIIGVRAANTRWGRSLYLVFDVKGRSLRLFGSRKRLEEVFTAAGFPNQARTITEGLDLNLPCRVIVKPTPDGRYFNIDRIFPAEPGH